MKGLVITTDNLMRTEEYTAPLHESIGKTVGGWIEVVHPKLLPAPYCMIVNEEGRLRGLPYNGRASDLWEGGGICLLNGDALLAAAKGEDLIGFTKPVCKTLAEFWSLDMEDGTWTD